MRQLSVTGAGYPGFAKGRRGDTEVVDDREAGTYSTPEELAPGEAEGRAARERMSAGLPALFGSVFVAFVVVAVVVLLVRYAL